MEHSGSRAAYEVPAEIGRHAAWVRLEDQLRYYSARSGDYRKRYQRTKVLQIVLGAAIPILAAVPDWDAFKPVSALLGAGVAALEAILQLFQWHALWLQYRGTAERLKRERWLLLAGAPPYDDVPAQQALVLLAERVEALLATEHESWAGAMTRPAQKAPAPAPVKAA